MTDKEEAAARKAFKKFAEVDNEISGLYDLRIYQDGATAKILGRKSYMTRLRIVRQGVVTTANVSLDCADDPGKQQFPSELLLALFNYYLKEADAS